MSGVVEKIKDKVQQATHSGPYAKEGDAAHTGTHTTGTHHTGTHTTGAHTTGTHTTGTGIGSTGTHTTGTHTTGTGIGSTSTNAGPHDSNLANKLDPRVDSDRDGSRTAGNTGAGVTGTTGTHTGTGLTGSHHTTGTHTGTGLTGTTGTHSSTSTAGPHSTNIANKLDPRVDSDRDGSNTLGSTTGTGYGSSTTGAGYGSTAGTGLGSHSGLGSTGAGYGSATGPTTGTAGPHSSNLLNKADPRVDSDLDGSRNAGAAGGLGGAGYGTTGTHSSGFGSTGTHNTGVGHSGVGHSGVGGTTGSGLTGSHSGPGPAANTAGPHSSDLLNKVDPRVDSDLDGSKTVGGNATYQPNHPATDTSDSSFTKSIDAAFRNDSVQKPTYAYQQVDGAIDDSSRSSTPPDAAKHTPEKFKEKQLRRGSITQQNLDDNEEYRREHLAGNEFKEALEKYGSGAK